MDHPSLVPDLPSPNLFIPPQKEPTENATLAITQFFLLVYEEEVVFLITKRSLTLTEGREFSASGRIFCAGLAEKFRHRVGNNAVLD